MGEFDAARVSHNEGLTIARGLGDFALVAEHLCRLAFMFYRLGEYGRAKEVAEEALAMADAVGDPNLQALAHDRLSTAEKVDDPEAGRWHYADALRLYGRAGNGCRISSTYNNLGDLEMFVGDLAAACTALEAALVQALTPDIRSVVFMNLGLVSVLDGNLEAAGSHDRDGLRRAVRLGCFSQVSYALLGLAVCAGAAGNVERSAELHGATGAKFEAQARPVEPIEADLRQKDITALRQRMGEVAFEAAYSRGSEMNGPQAIAIALGGDEDRTGA